MADYLETYAEHFALPIQLQTPVVDLQKHGETFVLQTARGTAHATAVIVATGPFHHPHIPAFASALSPQITQIHSSCYHNPSEIAPGPVLVVGAGDSGAHLATELAPSHPVFLAASHPPYCVPLTLLGQSLFWYLDRLRLLEVAGHTGVGRWLKAQPEPVVGMELKRALEKGLVHLKDRAIAAQDTVVQFAGDSQIQVRTVIWATGYRQEWSWIAIPEALDEDGQPNTHRGVSSVPGLFFLGLPWQPSHGSATVGWVGNDAERLAARIATTVPLLG